MRPEEVVQRQFRTARRGYDPEQVRAFLTVVAAELERQGERIASLEEQLLARPSRQRLLEAVGEEVTSILQAADALHQQEREELHDTQARIEQFLVKLGAVRDVLSELIETIRGELAELVEEVEAGAGEEGEGERKPPG
ncbi:MAG: DivIVA domain-containing protein [Acidimicrobiia bacterium]